MFLNLQIPEDLTDVLLKEKVSRVLKVPDELPHCRPIVRLQI